MPAATRFLRRCWMPVMATNTRRPKQVASMAEAALGGLDGKNRGPFRACLQSWNPTISAVLPAIAVLRSLVKRGANVRTYDAFITREAAAGAGLESFFL